MPVPRSSLSVTLYSPDTHVTCDPTTPETAGIGGGVTARLRLARALVGAGARVTAVLSCRRSAVEEGVEWVRLEERRPIECDVLLASTTGGDLSFAPLRQLDVRARLRVLWVEGFLKPHDIEALAPDVVCVASNFLRQIVVEEWGVALERVFVVYNGLAQESFARASQAGAVRDPFALCFTSHPSKGLDIALDVVRRLREHDPHFHLDVYGGYRLWGGTDDLGLDQPGVRDCGLVGQDELARRLFTYTFGFALQTFPEPFGIAVQELKRAGVIVLASPSGAFSELFLDGHDGFLLGGDPYGEDIRRLVVDRILGLADNPGYAHLVRSNAERTAWSWTTCAATMIAHWSGLLAGDEIPTSTAERSEPAVQCPGCRVPADSFPDGWHCPVCARLYPLVGGVLRFADEARYYGEVPRSEFEKILGAAAGGDWREGAGEELRRHSTFLGKYVLDEGRGLFSLLVDAPENGRALDVGAGLGTVTVGLSRQFAEVVALDNCPQRSAFLLERCRQDGIVNVEAVFADALSLPFQDRQFDLVTLIGALEWAGTWRNEGSPEDVQRSLLADCCRVLRPGGCLAIGIENRFGASYLLGQPDDHTGIVDITHISRSEADIRSMAERGVPYRVRTHGKNDYEKLLATCGFSRVELFAPYPDYRTWDALVPLARSGPGAYYFEAVADGAQETGAARTGIVETVAANLGVLDQLASTYLILAWR